MKNSMNRLTALILVLVLLGSLTTGVYASDMESLLEDGAEEAIQLEAVTINALTPAEAESLINGTKLFPQKTGWDKLDQRVEKVLSTGSAYDRLLSFYNWITHNMSLDDAYRWEGYSYTNPSLKAYNSVDGYDYLSTMTFDASLGTIVPDDMANRAYHLLLTKRGVSYDAAIAFAVAARAVGIESYVHTGEFILEDSTANSIKTGHTGWTVLVIDGKQYIFDAARDARLYQKEGANKNYYFGIPVVANAAFGKYSFRYNHKPDTEANKERDAAMAIMSYNVNVTTEGLGIVTGGGPNAVASTVTLTAIPDEGNALVGFYDKNGTLLTRNTTYSFPLKGNTSIVARFAPAVTVKLKASRSGTASGAGSYAKGNPVSLSATGKSEFQGWYDTKGNLISEIANLKFVAKNDVTYYALFKGDGFIDITDTDWFRNDAAEAAEMGLVNGTEPLIFSGREAYTRAMAAVMLHRMEGTPKASSPAPFGDTPAGKWYTDAVAWAYENGIIKGRSESVFDPDAKVTRQEFFTMVGRYITYKGKSGEKPELPFTDKAKISNYAVDSIKLLYSLGLVKGDVDGSVRPTDTLTRGEGTAVILRTAKLLGITIVSGGKASDFKEAPDIELLPWDLEDPSELLEPAIDE